MDDCHERERGVIDHQGRAARTNRKLAAIIGVAAVLWFLYVIRAGLGQL